MWIATWIALFTWIALRGLCYVDCGAAVHAVLLHCGAAVDRRSRHFYGAIRVLLCDPELFLQF